MSPSWLRVDLFGVVEVHAALRVLELVVGQLAVAVGVEPRAACSRRAASSSLRAARRSCRCRPSRRDGDATADLRATHGRFEPSTPSSFGSAGATRLVCRIRGNGCNRTCRRRVPAPASRPTTTCTPHTRATADRGASWLQSTLTHRPRAGDNTIGKRVRTAPQPRSPRCRRARARPPGSRYPGACARGWTSP